MDFMSFLMGGMFVADVLDEYDRYEEEEKEREIFDDCLYEMELARERLQDFIEERREAEEDFDDYDDEDDDF